LPDQAKKPPRPFSSMTLNELLDESKRLREQSDEMVRRSRQIDEKIITFLNNALKSSDTSKR
jgi:hypothetical protein